jgi:hypothetical protein
MEAERSQNHRYRCVPWADLESPHLGRVFHVVRISLFRTSADRRPRSAGPALPFGELLGEATNRLGDLIHICLEQLGRVSCSPPSMNTVRLALVCSLLPY